MNSTALHQSSIQGRASSTAQPSTTQQSPVYEYSCLFTHDIRRKNTKRWQDGFLRFHLFNKRVMVYDQSRNYIGDTHFQDAGSQGLEDGDELNLERGGVLVQVGEKLSVRQTDLSDLLAKRPPKAPPVQEAPPPRQREAVSAPNARQNSHPRPQSSNISSITPRKFTGWTGRAQLPPKSPFEVKHSESRNAHDGGWEEGRPAKRQRQDDEHVPLWQILRTPRPLVEKQYPAKSSINSKGATEFNIRSKDTRKLKPSDGNRKKAGAGSSRAQNLIDLVSSPENSAELINVDIHPTTGREKTKEHYQNLVGPVTAKIRDRPRTNLLSENRDVTDAERTGQALSSPPVSTTSDYPLPNTDQQGGSDLENVPSTPVEHVEKPSVPKKKTKPLRLATSAPRKMLFCQTMATLKEPRVPSIIRKTRLADENVSDTDRHAVPGQSKDESRARDLPASRDVVQAETHPPKTPTHSISNRFSANTSPFHNDEGDEEDAFETNKNPGKRSTAHRERIPTPAPAEDTHGAPQVTSDVGYGVSPCTVDSLPLPHLNVDENSKPIHRAESKEPAPEAQLAPGAIEKTTAAEPPPDIRPASPKIRDQAQQRNPLFRRHCSDTSPTKAPAPPPAQQGRASLKRADTVGGQPSEMQKRNDVRRRSSARQVLETAQKDADVGPWSREAWDLFGWCPEDRRETLAWGYDVEQDPRLAAAAAV